MDLRLFTFCDNDNIICPAVRINPYEQYERTGSRSLAMQNHCISLQTPTVNADIEIGNTWTTMDADIFS